MKNRGIDRIEWLLLGLLLLVLGASAVINFHAAHHLLDDDASSELMLAELLHREKSLYSDDFYYSTEYFVQNQLIFGALFSFFDGWANVRFFGTCVIQLLYLASFVYMMSQSGLGRKEVLFSAVLIMLPFTVVYGRTILYHCYYVSNFIATYLLTGLFFSFLREKKTGSFSTVFRLVLTGLISFLSSFLYIRQMFLTVIPLAGCLFFYLLVHSGSEKTDYQSWMLVPVLMLVTGGAGMLCNSRFLIPALDLFQQAGQSLNFLPTDSWGPMLAAVFIQFGFRTGVKLFSLAGLLSLGGLACAFLLNGFSIADLTSKENRDFRSYVLRTMLPVSLLVDLAIFIFGEVPYRLQADYSRYLVPASVWIVPLLSSRLSMPEKLPHFKRILYVFCTVIFAGNSIFNAVSFLNNGNFGQPYDGISYDDPRLADDLQGPIEFIKAHDYHYGYAFAGTANTLVELMNGFPVVSLRANPEGVPEYTNWLTLKSYKTVSADRAFFLMQAGSEELYAGTLQEAGAERIYFDDQGYVIYEIPDVALFRTLIREPE